jgi:hypothetical protein
MTSAASTEALATPSSSRFEASMMDHEAASEQLKQAESRVARADRRVTNQRRLVARLEREGTVTAKARKLLEELEQARNLHIADRDRLKRETA